MHSSVTGAQIYSFHKVYIYIGLLVFSNITLPRICHNIYTFQRDTQCSSTDCLLTHRCQLYMFRTVTVLPQELLCRYHMCRLWYVVRNALSGTSRWCNVWGRTGLGVVLIFVTMSKKKIKKKSIQLRDQFFLKRFTSGTYLMVRFLWHTIICTYST